MAQTRPEWIDEAVAAIHKSALVPTFPGDVSITKQFIDKLVTRLFSECHYGGEIGKDDCPVCRSVKTEDAQRVLASLHTKYQAVQEELATLRTSHAALKDANDFAAAETLRRNAQFAELEAALDRAQSQAARARQECEAVTATLQTTQRDYTTVRAAVQEYSQELNDTKTRLASLRAAIKQLEHI